MASNVRPAQEGDLEAAAGVVRECISNLRARHGYDPTVPPLPTQFLRFCLSADARGLWVAEEDSRIVGFGFSWLADSFWFLAQLFIHPSQQGSHVGTTLLNRTLEQATLSGATNKALITFAYNPGSIGLYVKHGLYARLPLYRWSIAGPPAVPSLVRARYQCVPMQHLGPQGWIEEIDSDTLGFQRAQHHAFLQNVQPDGVIQIVRSGDPVGYAYVSPSGHIGPLAMKSSESIEEGLLAVVMHLGKRQTGRMSVIIPGPAEGASELASSMGFRIAEPLLLMSARPFGPRNYFPRDPSYM